MCGYISFSLSMFCSLDITPYPYSTVSSISDPRAVFTDTPYMELRPQFYLFRDRERERERLYWTLSFYCDLCYNKFSHSTDGRLESGYSYHQNRH